MMAPVWATLTVLTALVYAAAQRTRTKVFVALVFGVFFYLWMNTSLMMRWWLGL